MTLSLNHKYLLNNMDSLRDHDGNILDYGCGKGLIVEEGLRQGIPIFGCELFGPGSGVAIRDQLRQKGLLGERVREIAEERIPFPDEYFELVVSNAVFEHIPHLEPVLAEISRVLKPSGKLLCIFPVRECYRDHAGTLFAHWLPPYSKAQYYTLLFFRSLGFGRLKKGQNRNTPRKWAKFFVKWLAENAWYRPQREVEDAFGRHFATIGHLEEEYIRFRLKQEGFHRIAGLADVRPGQRFFQWACIRWCDVVMLAEKGD